MNYLITEEEVRKYVNPHNLSLLPIRGHHRVAMCKPDELRVNKRFDVMAKYLYAKHRMIGGGLEWASRIYEEHLLCHGNYTEGDGSGKVCFDDYVSKYDELLDSIRDNGFLEDKGYIPVGRDGVIIDGTHRLAACLLYDRPLYTVEFDVDVDGYDYKQFMLRGLRQESLDAMALEYIRIARNVHIAIIFPLAASKYEEAYSVLGEYGDIVYEKSAIFTKIGRRNLIRLLYRGEKWLGREGELTSGLLHHSENRFLNKGPVTFVFIKCDDPMMLREAKSRVRSLYNLNNDPIHINDAEDSTLNVAELALNKNSLKYINQVDIDLIDPSFRGKLFAYNKLLKKDGVNRELYCIDSGGVLALYGMRQTHDLDYIHIGKKLDDSSGEGISSHNEELCYYDKKVDELIFNPENHFYYEGLKCMSIDNVRSAKARRRCKKDFRDIELIDSVRYVNGAYVLFNWHLLRRKLKFIRHNLFNYIIFKIKMRVPRRLYPLARSVYRIPLYVKEYLKPYNRVLKYKGYMLHYTRGTPLIKKIWLGETYEPELTNKIITELRGKSKPVYVDIGAKIGLMTLNVMAALPNALVHAFEPEKTKFDLLRKTVDSNNITESVYIYQHGFENLDDWWRNVGRKCVDLLNIDTGGSELRVIQGAREIIEVCAPKIFIVMNKNCVKTYNPSDIIRCLNNMGYRVGTMAGTKVNENSINDVLEYSELFVANMK